MKINKKYFKTNKSLPIDKFFYEVLYNKKYGYYNKKNPFEKKGDFITSPSVSFLFGEIIAIWIISVWKNLGSPKKFNIVELGPGNGKLAETLIKTFKRFPIFYNSVSIFLDEKSIFLKKYQKEILKNKKIKWVSNYKEVKKGPVIFIGNEFFDAIPIKQFQKKKKLIKENFVQIDKNYNIKIIQHNASKKDIIKLNKFKVLKKNNFIEYPMMGFKKLQIIINKIKKQSGGVLLIDYGYFGVYNNNSLQSVKNHKTNNLFDDLGNADITSLVNFNLLKEFMTNNNLKVEKIVTQSYFLKRLGILIRAEIISKNMSFKNKSDLYLRLKRLLDPKYMGELFKVIFAHTYKKKNFIGFN